jgi:hypothetical protein
MKNLRWQLLIVVVALVAIGVLLLIQKPTVLSGIEQVLEPATGGVYIEALVGTLGRLNPILDYYNTADQDENHGGFRKMVKFITFLSGMKLYGTMENPLQARTFFLLLIYCGMRRCQYLLIYRNFGIRLKLKLWMRKPCNLDYLSPLPPLWIT